MYRTIVLLVLVCGAFALPHYETYCLDAGGTALTQIGAGVGVGGIEIPDTFRDGRLSIDGAFTTAWSFPNPYSAGCGHLATFDTQEEFNAIVSSMAAVGATASLIGARRNAGLQTYYWSAGALRGRNYITIESTTFTCFQDFCLPASGDVLSVTQDIQTGLNLVIWDFTGTGAPYSTELSPTEGAECFTIEYPEVAEVADASVLNGNTPYPPGFTLYHEPLPYFQMEEALVKRGQFIARVGSATQNQWIIDEFQCSSRYRLWLGYFAEEDVLRCASGPDDGTIIAATGDTTCDVYCNFSGPQKFEEDESVYLAPFDSEFWGLRSRAARYWALAQTEVCPADPTGFTSVCTNTTSTDWYQLLPSAQAMSQIESGASFYPGGPFFFDVDFDQYALYFDCNCKTDYRVHLPCLGTNDIANCILVGTSDESTENSSYSTHSSADPHSSGTTYSSRFY